MRAIRARSMPTLALCRDHGADVLFAPSAQEVYPEPLECTVDVGHLADHLCGKFRPGHFRGVATVVLKLFQMVQPHRAYFGEKDAQQLAIIRRLVARLQSADRRCRSTDRARGRWPRDELAQPASEPGGTQRSRLHCIEALDDARRRILAGERDGRAIREAAAARIPQSDQHVVSGFSRTVNVRLEYLEIVDPATMQPVDEVDRPVRVAGALWVGSTRLIDNMLVQR